MLVSSSLHPARFKTQNAQGNDFKAVACAEPAVRGFVFDAQLSGRDRVRPHRRTIGGTRGSLRRPVWSIRTGPDLATQEKKDELASVCSAGAGRCHALRGPI